MERESRARQQLLVHIKQQDRLRLFGRCGCSYLCQCISYGIEIDGFQCVDTSAGRNFGEEAGFLGRYRTETHAGIKDRLVEALLWILFNTLQQGVAIGSEEVQLVLPWRQLIAVSWQDGTDTAAVRTNFTQSVDD